MMQSADSSPECKRKSCLEPIEAEDLAPITQGPPAYPSIVSFQMRLLYKTHDFGLLSEAVNVLSLLLVGILHLLNW
jgi:hypothetical protein